MKNTYQILYVTAAVIFLMVLFGGTVTKPVFMGFAERTLETAGIEKSKIDSVDGKIDDIIYSVNKVQLQIEKMKNIFSDKEIDLEKFRKRKNETFANIVYYPLSELVIVFYRVTFFFLGFVILLFAVIAQLISRGISLRKRITEIENDMLTIKKSAAVL